MNTKEKDVISIGIDPGWVNLGLAVVAKSKTPGKVIPIATKVFCPKKDPLVFTETLPVIINQLIDKAGWYLPNCEISHLQIERYAPYNNVMTAEAENIGMLIGGIRSRFFINNPCSDRIEATMYRAIDWKIKLVQQAASKYGFNNPSDKLDKKYSFAMAKFLMEKEHEIPTDHEADALCLASLPFVL